MEKLDSLTQTQSTLSLLNTNFDMTMHGAAYINSLRMFLCYYNALPNLIVIKEFDFAKFKLWFEKSYPIEIIKQHYRHDYNLLKKKLEITDHFYFLGNSIVLNADRDSLLLMFLAEEEQKANLLFEQLKSFIKKPKTTTDISLIVVDKGDLETKELFIIKPKINFGLHYNADFTAIHKDITRQLNKSNSKGLYLFHGFPGTGKSTYIKYLIHQLKKKVIFLSPKMAGDLDNLNMTSFLIANRNSVLVIEDAEELISSRDNIRNSNLSMLLNMTDGILGESLGIQIIATFNTDLKNIDKALLRKGRLTSIYEFKYLAVDKTNDLLKSLGHNIEVTTPLPLAEIFNFDINNNYEPKLKKAVGFGN
jgi:hypothetical protein